MTQDTRKAANADADIFGRLPSAATNLNAAQMWWRQANTEDWGTDFSQRDFEAALDKVSRPEKTPEKAS